MSDPKSSAPAPGADAPLLPSEIAAAASERPCPECGEKVRAGLVRCWNCGAFMKKELAQKYAEMQAAPQKIIFSEVLTDEAVSVGDVDDDETGFELKVTGTTLAGAESPADDDLGGGYSLKLDAAPVPAAPVKAEGPRGARPATEEPAGVSHSVATAGDVLLEGAMNEEQELRKRRKQRGVSLRGGARTPGGFVIYCPYGCRIEVKDQHRGMTGQCPKCRAPFIVPTDPPDYGYRERAAAGAAPAEAGGAAAAWSTWMNDLHLHTVAPEKLKLKAGSLVKEFAPVDAVFLPDSLLILNFAPKKGGLFGGGDKKKGDPRPTAQQHLREGKPANETPASEVRLISRDELAQLRVAQPAANPTESMFAGIAVFGEKQIAVQLPLVSGQPPQFLSFGITGFRQFVKAVAQTTGGFELSATGVPADESYSDFKCHYSDVPVKALKDVEWYQADSAAGVVLAGWKCAACGLVVSEDARKKEGLGGKGGKGIAKAKCPKCSNKFGEVPLYTLPSQLTAPTMGETPA
jgi:hypothetical protein